MADLQYLRKVNLMVFGTDLNGLDLSNLRIKFDVKQTSVMTPNMADIRIYNLELNTALQIQKEFKQVVLQAGYEGNYGVIFKGNIKQVILGRESATDTFVDIIAGDGDRAYNFAIVNKTLAAGSTQMDQVTASADSLGTKGVSTGFIADMPPEKLPRGKVMYGNARNYLRNVSSNTDSSWSIQNEKLTIVKLTSYAPGEAVELTSKTGLIGTPQQTNIGVNCKCLLNPRLGVNGRIKLDNASIERLKINLAVAGSPANTAAPLRADGFYFVLAIEHQGDTRGTEWYTSLICLNMSATSNPANAVDSGV